MHSNDSVGSDRLLHKLEQVGIELRLASGPDLSSHRTVYYWHRINSQTSTSHFAICRSLVDHGVGIFDSNSIRSTVFAE